MIQIIVNSVLQLHTTSGHGTEGDDKTFERPANRDGLATGKQLRCDWRGRGVSSWKCFFSGLHWPAMTPFVLARFLHWIATGWCIRYRSAKASTGPRVDVCRRNVIGATFIEFIHLVPPFVRSISDKFFYLYISLVRGCWHLVLLSNGSFITDTHFKLPYQTSSSSDQIHHQLEQFPLLRNYIPVVQIQLVKPFADNVWSDDFNSVSHFITFQIGWRFATGRASHVTVHPNHRTSTRPTC